MSTTNTQPQPRILRTRDVTALVGVHRSTLFRWATARIFPAPRQIGRQRVGWYAEEVEEWLRTRQEHRSPVLREVV